MQIKWNENLFDNGFCHVNQSQFPGRHQSFRNCLCSFRITKFAFMDEYAATEFQIYRAIKLYQGFFLSTLIDHFLQQQNMKCQ